MTDFTAFFLNLFRISINLCDYPRHHFHSAIFPYLPLAYRLLYNNCIFKHQQWFLKSRVNFCGGHFCGRCPSLRPSRCPITVTLGPGSEFAALSALGIQAGQLRPSSAEIPWAPGIKLASVTSFPWTKWLFAKPPFTRCIKEVQIRDFYSVLHSGILLLPWLPYKNTDSLFTFPRTNKRTPVTDKESTSNALTQRVC